MLLLMLEVKSKRIGGATYQVPVEVAEGRRISSCYEMDY